MESSTIIVVGVVLALLAALSLILMQVSSKEYPTKEEEEYVRPKFQPRKVTDLSTSEAPKRKKKRYYNKKKKPTGANDAQVEKRPVGRPKKSN